MAGKRKSLEDTTTSTGNAECRAPTTRGDASGRTLRRASKRPNSEITAVATQNQGSGAGGVSLGCSKCRFSPRGCGRCRARAAAAAAPAAPADVAVVENTNVAELASSAIASKKVKPTAKPDPAAQPETAPEAKPRRSLPRATSTQSPLKSTRRTANAKEPVIAAAEPESTIPCAPTSRMTRNRQLPQPSPAPAKPAPRELEPRSRRSLPNATSPTQAAPKIPVKTRSSLDVKAVTTKSALKAAKSPMKTRRPVKQSSCSPTATVVQVARQGAGTPISPPQSRGPPPESARKHRTQTSMAQDMLVTNNPSPAAVPVAGSASDVDTALPVVAEPEKAVLEPIAASLPVAAELEAPSQQPAAAVVEVQLSGPSSPSSAAQMLEEREREVEVLQSACKDDTWWDPLDPGKVSQAKGALHVSAATAPGQLPLCRERQVEAIDSWLQTRLTSAQGGSLYLSGLPGTGKSLTAMELARRCVRHADAPHSLCKLPPAVMGINCMRLTEPRQVVERILAGYRTACRRLSIGSHGSTAADDSDALILVADEEEAFERRGSSAAAAEDAWSALRRIALGQASSGNGMSVAAAAAAPPAPARRASAGRKSLGGSGSLALRERGMIVVVLDELDGLLSGRHGDELVGELFALAACPRSRLVLLGIANSIDLVQQLMRPGGAFHRHNLRPAHEMFPAYMRNQVSKLISLRLASLPGPVFEPSAIEFCARKVANGSGDMRRALEAASQAVDMLLAEEHNRVKKQQADTDNQQGETSVEAGATAPKKVGMRHMAAALSKVTGGIGASNDNVSAIKKLPVPQQLLMCTVGKLLGETLAGRGLTVKAPKGGPPGMASTATASRFIGNSGLVSEPLLLAPAGTSKSLSESHRRRSSMTGANAPRKARDLTLAELEGAHRALCKRVGVEAYSSMEFATATDMLCTLGLMELTGCGGDRKRHRVMLRVAEDDLLMALADVPVLKDVVGA